MKTAEQKVKELESQLSKAYLKLSEFYKRLSKNTDAVTFNYVQSAIDINIATAADLREKLEAARRDFLKEWEDSRNASTPGS